MLRYLTVAALLASCARPTSDDSDLPPGETDGAAAPDTVDTGSAETDGTDDTAAPSDLRDVELYFSRQNRNGYRWVEAETHVVDAAPNGLLHATVEALLQQPPDNPWLDSVFPRGTALRGVDISGTVLRVDLSREVQFGSNAQEEKALAQQLAHTGAALSGIDSVQLLVEGEEIETLWSSMDWSNAFEPDPFALTPVTIESPLWGTSISSATHLEVSGQATVFEATLTAWLKNPSGEVVAFAYPTATCGAPCRGVWNHIFTTVDLTVGTWTVGAEEPDPSGGEGRGPAIIEVEFTVTP